jgi:hypothetical protein
MAVQDLLFTHPAVAEKPVDRLNSRPVLTGPGNAPSHLFAQLFDQIMQPFFQPRIRQRRGRQFLLDPILAQSHNIGHAIRATHEPDLRQYTHLGNGASKTDGRVYDPKLGPNEMKGDYSDKPDDRWFFTSNKELTLCMTLKQVQPLVP